jgi:hypothetical protein
MVGDSSSSYNIDHGVQVKDILNPGEHPNYRMDSKVTVIFQQQKNGFVLLE